MNGDGAIENGEGGAASAPNDILGTRDAQRQTAADLMHWYASYRSAWMWTANGAADLDASRIYYFGISFGGAFGFIFLAVEPDVRAGVLSTPGGLNGRNDLARMRPAERPDVGVYLGDRSPSLLNSPGLTHVGGIEWPRQDRIAWAWAGDDSGTSDNQARRPKTDIPEW